MRAHTAPATVRARRDHLDPDLRAYLRAPYDPLNSARATRFLVRVLLHQPPARGWMRPFALLLALACLGGLGGNLAMLLGLIMGGSPDAVVAGLQAVFVFGPVGAFGAVLLRRVLRAWGRKVLRFTIARRVGVDLTPPAAAGTPLLAGEGWHIPTGNPETQQLVRLIRRNTPRSAPRVPA